MITIEPGMGHSSAINYSYSISRKDLQVYLRKQGFSELALTRLINSFAIHVRPAPKEHPSPRSIQTLLTYLSVHRCKKDADRTLTALGIVLSSLHLSPIPIDGDFVQVDLLNKCRPYDLPESLGRKVVEQMDIRRLLILPKKSLSDSMGTLTLLGYQLFPAEKPFFTNLLDGSRTDINWKSLTHPQYRIGWFALESMKQGTKRIYGGFLDLTLDLSETMYSIDYGKKGNSRDRTALKYLLNCLLFGKKQKTGGFGIMQPVMLGASEKKEIPKFRRTPKFI